MEQIIKHSKLTWKKRINTFLLLIVIQSVTSGMKLGCNSIIQSVCNRALFQQTSNDSHVYECLSSSPECDSNLELRHGSNGCGDGFRGACKRKSDSSVMSGEPKVHHHQPFMRSTSLPYCGSETESELYAPYTFYTGDEVCVHPGFKS